VFEDDIVLREREFSTLLKHLELLPVDESKVIHLGGQEGIAQANRVLRLKKDGPEKLAMKRVFMPTVRWLYRTCGYLINRKAAEALIRAHNEHSFVADDWSFVLKKSGINGISYYDAVIHPLDLSNSTIEAERKK
jgi:glycosyl transferase family 25